MTSPVTDLERILVVKLADLGDAVLSTAAITALREAYPTARIDVLGTDAGRAIFEMCPAVDEVITFPKELFDRPAGLLRPGGLALSGRLALRLRRGHYDAIVLLHHLTTSFGAAKYRALTMATGAGVVAGLDNGRGRFLTHRVTDFGYGAESEMRYFLQVAGSLTGTVIDRRPHIQRPVEAEAFADRLLADSGVNGPFIVIHPSVGGYSPARNWPIDRFAQLAQELCADWGATIVLVGASNAAEDALTIQSAAPVVNLVGRTTVPQLAAVLARAQCVIGADSGVMHLAAAVGSRVAVIFGPSNHHAWQPVGAGVQVIGNAQIPEADVIVIRSDIPCSPCFYTGYSLGRRNGCALRTCLEEVTVGQVVRIVRHLVERKSAGQIA